MGSVFIYHAVAYVRASKEDVDSSTIENQIELIHDYVKQAPEIHIVSVREDNGFSGIDFLRPSFGKMMKDIEIGKINCVIVKDLSRLGRNYIEVGEMIEEVFPQYKVRLIAINDHYDSLNPRSDADEIMIPFKNLINEQYLRDFSIKIRSNLHVKRKNGDFVAAFAPYGYKRDENDKYKLVIDEQAAEVVRDIFQWKMEGMSQQNIAERLNGIGVYSPAEYKKQSTHYTAKFQTHVRASWSAVAIGRILRNTVYIGVLVQGKQTTPNYKVKKRIEKPEDEWYVTSNAHEAIIHKSEFEIVNGLLSRDTRTAPRQETVYPLSGLAFCGDCGNNMVRTKSGRVYYYICASSRAKKKTCTSHCVQELKLESAVTDAIAYQIAYVLDMERSLQYVRSLPNQRKDIIKLNAQIIDREQEIKSCENFKRSLYEDYKNGIISKEDYVEFGKDYTVRIKELQHAAARLQEEATRSLNNDSSAYKWLEHFLQYKNLPELSRRLVVSLIERIEVWGGERVSLQFRYQDTLEAVRREECVHNGQNKQKSI